MKEILFLSLFPILIIASVWDLKTKRIPNALIFIGLVSGLTLSMITGGISGLFGSLVAVFITFVAFIFLWGVMGAGDIKLLIAMSSFIGAKLTIAIGFSTLFLFSLVSMVLLHKKNKVIFKNLTYFIFYKVPMQAEKKEKGIAFSPFITIVYIIFYFIQN